ncbi:MAG TPA: FKBP-type peptidyl-prolyl cis-trans isomerase [Gemmatimonadaceae bacterium]|nr:FKBP-type peptidyl-prolyl cis-trans isomerase [Gemmatimonadaceae bacterium]
MRRTIYLLIAASVLACTGEIAGLGPPSDPARETYAPSLGINLAVMTKTADGLYFQDLAQGTGYKIVKDTTVTVNYTGYLVDGTIFDASNGAQLATNSVVPGFREGLMGMAVGGHRRIVIPSALGYGEAGSPPRIPRQSTLVFDIVLRSVP